jgi:phosphonate transport system substrate-binding protein
MRFRMIGLLVCAALVFAAGRDTALAADAPARKARVLRLGGVAYSPDSVTIWSGIRHYFAKNGVPVDYVLYSTYDQLVEALQKGQVDIAWNSPLAHGKFHALAGGQSQTLVMRDVDCGYRVQLIVRKDAGIASLADLPGKTMVFGSCDSAEATVLPIYFFKKEGASFDKIKILSLHKEVDALGCPCHSEKHVLKALQKGQGDAGIVSLELWKQFTADQPAEAAKFKSVWVSPPFSHCVFTAKKDFNKKLGERFTKLMLAMDMNDPLTAQILRLEQAGRWVAGSQEGYAPLLEALRDSDTVTLAR